MASNSSSAVFLDKHVAVRSVVGITCILSMLGSVLIIISYFCVKELRTTARQLLVNLSLMDFCVGLTNLIGISVYFDRYYYNKTLDNVVDAPDYIDDLCQAQAFFAHFSTFASILWTITLAIYMYFTVFRYNSVVNKFIYIIGYPLNYGLTFGLCMWLVMTKRLGHSPYNSSGWCGIILVKKDHSIDLIATTIGYDLLVYLAIFICTAVYVAILMFLKTEYSKAKKVVGSKTVWMSALGIMDFRLIFIPAAFVILRIWTCIVNIMFSYAQVDPKSLPQALALAVIILSGIGDSGQGAANGLLFVVFTEGVRKKLFPVNKYCCQKQAASSPLLKDEDKGPQNITPNSSLT